MNPIFYTIILAILLLTNHKSMAQEIVSYKLIWSDEFENQGLPDSTKWNYEQGCSIRNHESQYYTYKNINNAYCNNGILTLGAHLESVNNCTVTSASITTKGKFEFTYGKVEIRAKIPKGAGTWPALWMMADSKKYGQWPKNGEIDLLESVGWDANKIHCNIHTEAYNHVKKTNKGKSIEVPNLYNEFHVYTLEWSTAELAFYMDDEIVFTYENETQVDDPTIWPYNRPFYLLMNLAIGGDWGGVKGVDTNIFPAKFEIDYVRVYQR
ncbi:MAG: glycoside hydrolase family 16 protein [Bacteroidota bacterium]|nr:glycoside hydrolase family 16 protein [Bacteroidota bacterium]